MKDSSYTLEKKLLAAECSVWYLAMWYPTYWIQNVETSRPSWSAVFTRTYKGERLKFQTSMPSRQLAALGLKVKDSIQRRDECVKSGIHVKNESFICRGPLWKLLPPRPWCITHYQWLGRTGRWRMMLGILALMFLQFLLVIERHYHLLKSSVYGERSRAPSSISG